MAHANPLTISRTSIGESLNNARLTSRRGHKIELFQLRDADSKLPKPNIYFQGALHGNETLTTEFLKWLLEEVRTQRSPFASLVKVANIDIIPVVNPDSFGSSRFNAIGVNLNRNFGAFWGTSRENFGPSPLSEPETKALDSLFRANKYAVAIDIHGYVNWVVTPSMPSNEIIDKQTQVAYNRWQKVIADQLPLLTKLAPYRQKTALGLGDGGAFEDWAFWNHGTYAACLEMAVPKREKDQDAGKLDSFKVYEKFLFQVALRGLAARDMLDINNKNRLVATAKKAVQVEGSLVHH